METGQQECRLYVQTLPPNPQLHAALSGEGSWTGQMFGINALLEEGWRVVSHSFEWLEDSEGNDQFLFSCVLVRQR